MSTVKIRTNRQLTIPEDVFDQMDLGVGDALEAEVREGKLVLTPKSATTLSAGDEKLLQRTRRKIARIRQDPTRSRGLTPEEADLAARAGLIHPDQRWWWIEAWQRGERQTERELKAGRLKTFASADHLVEDLRKR